MHRRRGRPFGEQIRVDRYLKGQLIHSLNSYINKTRLRDIKLLDQNDTPSIVILEFSHSDI